jgi:uncharacterized protein (TIGR02996 family)
MNDELAFVEQVRLHPHDDTPRLIYADFLDDAGDPQGELIRVQVELANLPPGDERRVGLAARESELLEEYGETWLAPLRELGAIGVTTRSFHRGLIERVRIDTSRFLETGDALCEISPALNTIELREAIATAATDDLAVFDMPTQITAIDLSANRLAAEHIATLRHAPWLAQISDLNLQFNALRDEGVQQLVEAEMPRLRGLRLGINQIGPPGAQALASWPTLANVEQLSLRVNPLGDIGIEHLMASPLVGNLRKLDVASCRITARGATAIKNSRHLPALDEVLLSGNQIAKT